MEKLYSTMRNSGILGILTGVCTVVMGVLIIISSIVMLKNRSKLLF